MTKILFYIKFSYTFRNDSTLFTVFTDKSLFIEFSLRSIKQKYSELWMSQRGVQMKDALDILGVCKNSFSSFKIVFALIFCVNDFNWIY